MKQYLAHIALFLVALFYAANYTVAKEVMPTYVPPFGFILLRVVFAVSVFWLLFAAFRGERMERKDLGRAALAGLLGVALNQLLFFKGLNWTYPIHASLLMTTTPILVLIAGAIILKERITLTKVLGIAIGAAGAILLLVNTKAPAGASASNMLLGDFLVFLNATSYAGYLVVVKPLMQKYSPLTVVRWVFTFGLLYVLPFGLPDMRVIDWDFPVQIWYAIAFVLVFVTVAVYLLNGYALGRISASVVSTYIYLQPLLAALIAVLAGRDELTLIAVVSGALIFVGVFLASRKPKPVADE